MTDIQFDILDELYFVISFDDLEKELELSRSQILNNLGEMIQMNWVKCFKDEMELELNEIKFIESEMIKYQFLATKKGLFAHNSR